MTLLDLTPKQSTVLQYWQSFQKENGNPPSLNGAAKVLGFKSTFSMTQIMDSLISKGLIKKEPQPGVEGRHIYVAVSDEQTK